MKLSRRLLAVSFATIVFATTAYAQNSAGDQRALLAMINEYRRANGAQPLVIDQRLVRAAQQHVAAMVAGNSVSHDIGGGFDARMNANGIRGLAAENVAGGHRDVAAAFADWQSSSLHNGNMLNPRIRRMGLGRAQGADGRHYWALVLSAN